MPNTNKLIFGTSQEANEFVGFAKSKGYDVSKPIKEKRAQSRRKAYDLDGKLLKYQWKVIMGARGKGKRGASKEEHWEDMQRHSVDITDLGRKPASENGIGKRREHKDQNTERQGVHARHHYEGMEYGEQN